MKRTWRHCSALAASLLAASMLLSACQPAPAASPSPVVIPSPSAPAVADFTYADTLAWDGQYDVIVVGFGGAGAVAAKSAADAGAKVLLVEKAPEGQEGGNTRFCGQLFVYGNNDAASTAAYYKALSGSLPAPEAMFKVYTDGIATLKEKLIADFGCDPATMKDWTGDPAQGHMSPEYPEFAGSDKISLCSLTDEIATGVLWQMLRDQVTDRSDSIDVWFESPAVSLVQDPNTKTILGVTVERKGTPVDIRATNGIVLATGGFENNPEMIETYLGLSRSAAVGTLYNTGDGVRMAMEVGADLWHMGAYEGITGLGGSSLAVAQGERLSYGAGLSSGSAILVGGDGSRYLREDESPRHGHVYHAGTWVSPQRPDKSYVVADQKQYEKIGPTLAPAIKEQVLQADTLAGLAEVAGMSSDILAATVESFNTYARTGQDLQLGRSAASMTAFSDGPFYAIEIIAGILNTQGGPRRDESAQVLDVNGAPIPNLYSAGELGGITSLQYQGGGNIAECIIFGEIAGKNAAAAKDALPVYTPPTAVKSSMLHTPGTTSDIGKSDIAAPEIALGENEYLGMGEGGMGGPLYVKVTMDGDKIAKVEIVQHAESAGISDPAIEKLPAAIVAANSADVDAISGATLTSTAIQNAVADALSQVK